MQQVALFEEELKWTPERVYESFAGPLAKCMPFDTLDHTIRRFYRGVADRWNASSLPCRVGLKMRN